MTSSLQRRGFIAAGAAMFLADVRAQANAGLPAGPIRMLLPFSPGGGPDTIARLLAQHFSADTGVALTVENRTGANGIIASRAVANANADGNTLLYTTGSHAINATLYKKLPYDTLKDFAPVTLVNLSPSLILVVAPNFPAQTFNEFLEAARKPNSRISFGSPGIGNTLHLAGEMLNVRAGINMLHVPYKGGAQALTGVMAGDVTATFIGVTAGVGAIKAGQVRALAVTGGARLPALPNVPTIAESGFPGFDYDGGWNGILAPAKTPKETIDRLSSALTRVIRSPEVSGLIESTGTMPKGTSPDEFGKFIQANVQKFSAIVKQANIPLQGD